MPLLLFRLRDARVHWVSPLRRSPGDAENWVWLAYDQLNVAFLESLDLDNIGVVLIESSSKAKLRPYHQQKVGRALGQSASFCA